jgi:RNA polymerase-binding transcription factor DksA
MLQERLKEIEQILCEPEDHDLEEWASEWDDDNVLDGLARMTREEIGLIREALRRMDEGTYGRCEACRRPIGLRRLRALPQAAACVRCARAAA